MSGAAGPNDYLEVVDQLVAVYDRSFKLRPGSPDVLSALTGQPPGTQLSSPHVEWDPGAARWLYAALASAPVSSFILFGWSKGADPTNFSNGWCRFSQPSVGGVDDFPTLGHDDTYMSIGSNLFDAATGSFLTARVYVIPKPAPADTSCQLPALTIFPASGQLANGDGTPAFSPVAANMFDGAPSGFVVAAHDVSSPPPPASSGRLSLWQIDRSSTGLPRLSVRPDLSVPAYDIPADAPQPGPSSPLLDTLDARLTQAVGHYDPVAQSEALWTQHTVAGSGGRSELRWYELLPNAGNVAQQGVLSAPDAWLFDAAISPTSAGDAAAISYNRAGWTRLPEIVAQSRRAATAAGAFDPDTVVLGYSRDIDQDFSCALSCSWGGYAAASPDPSQPDVVWGSGQLTGPLTVDQSAQWETANFQLPAALNEGSYRPLTPARVLDTRAESRQGSCDPGPCGRLTSGQTLNVRVAGQGGVPAAGVTAVVLNVTAVDAGASGYLTVYPAGVARPTASNLNFEPGQTVANLAEVAVGEGGEVSVYNLRGGTDVVFDVVGYVTPGAAVAGVAGAYRPLTPARLLDTRAESRQGSCRPGCARLGPGGSLDLQVSGAGGVPASGVSAVVLNVTVTGPSAGGYLTLYPAGQGRPLASNLNFRPGQTVANRVMVGLGEQGRVSIFNSAGGSDVVVDVGGWYTDGSDAQARGALYGAQAPRRILDTRETGGTLGAGQSLSLGVGGAGGVPADASAAVLNVTATGTTAASYLTVYPSGQARPLASDLNWAAGERRPNLVLVKLGSGGRVEIYNLAGRADIVVDVMGWYR